jgi:heme A synthase
MFGLVTLQPVLAGRGWFQDRQFIDIHGYVANAIFPISLLLLGLALFAGFRRRNLLAGWSFLLVVLVVSQIGMGYVATAGNPDIAALHIPLGVVVFGVSLMLMLLAYGFTTNRENV